MTEIEYPQCRIVPLRLLYPETAERLLDSIVRIKGIRRMMINGPRLPSTVPYGPAKGTPNPHPARKVIRVGDADVELHVQVGQVVLEVEDTAVIDEIRRVCDEIFVSFPYVLQEGTFMKRKPSVADYAKYGPDADEAILGLADPRSKECPVIIQSVK